MGWGQPQCPAVGAAWGSAASVGTTADADRLPWGLSACRGPSQLSWCYLCSVGAEEGPESSPHPHAPLALFTSQLLGFLPWVFWSSLLPPWTVGIMTTSRIKGSTSEGMRLLWVPMLRCARTWHAGPTQPSFSLVGWGQWCWPWAPLLISLGTGRWTISSVHAAMWQLLVMGSSRAHIQTGLCVEPRWCVRPLSWCHHGHPLVL